MDFRLERLHAALGALGNPERGLPAIQVAGTNGKGSTAAMIHSVYSEAGYRCGLFTSPHLQTFRERIRVGADFIDEDRVVDLVERVAQVVQRGRLLRAHGGVASSAASGGVAGDAHAGGEGAARHPWPW